MVAANRTELVRQAEGEERRHQERAPVESQRGAGEPAEGHRSGEHGGDVHDNAHSPPRRRCVSSARSSTTVAQLRPLAPQIPEPGNVAAPVR